MSLPRRAPSGHVMLSVGYQCGIPAIFSVFSVSRAAKRRLIIPFTPLFSARQTERGFRRKKKKKSSHPAFVIIQFWHHKSHILALDFGMVAVWTRPAAELWLKCNLHLGEASAGFLVSGKTFLTTLHAALATLSHPVSTS